MKAPTFEQVPFLLAQILENQNEIKTQLAELNRSGIIKELLSIKDVCELLDINRSTLWKWVNADIIPAYRIEKRRYFKRSEILTKLKHLESV